jgi:tellurite resistance protein TehA-like permease
MQTVFLRFSDAKGMVLTVANTNNLAIGLTAILVLINNHRFLPRELRPRWYNTVGMSFCAIFYLSMTVLVFAQRPEVFWFFGLFVVWVFVWWLLIKRKEVTVG